ncbi:MAG: protein kinase [Mariniblastus sp.]
MADCPTSEKLKKFNEGRIGDFVEVDQISDHIGKCVRCLRILDEMPLGPLADGLRASNSDEATIEDWELNESSGSFHDLLTRIRSTSESSSYLSVNALGENRYEVFGSVGDGEFGRAVGAFPIGEQRSDENLLVVKIPWLEKLSSERHQQQFFDDCKQAQLLNHPNILPNVDYGFWDSNRVFYTTAFLHAQSLSTFARREPVIVNRTLIAIFTQTANAIGYAHQTGVLHRHLNPNNIFLGLADDEPLPHIMVTDFGFSLDSRYQFELLEKSNVKNPFASPESRNSDAAFIDERADIYSLGKILKLLHRLLVPNGEPTNRFESCLNPIIKKSTTKRRRDRYQTLNEFLTEFQSCVDEHAS